MHGFFAFAVGLVVGQAAPPGSLLWETKPGCRDLIGMVEVAGVVVAGNQTDACGVMGFSADSGKRLWRRPVEQPLSIPTTDGVRLYAVLGSQTRQLAALDPKTGKDLWLVPVDDKLGRPGGPVTDGQLVYVLSGAGTLTAWNAKTGAQTWQLDWGAPDPDCPTALTLADGVLYFGGGRGWPRDSPPKALWAVEAASGKVRWQAVLPPKSAGKCVTTPAVSGGLVVTTSGELVLGLDGTSGQVRWQNRVHRLEDGQERSLRLSPVALAPEVGLVLAAFPEGLAAFSLADGSNQWEVPGTISRDSDRAVLKVRGGVVYFTGLLAGEDESAGKWPLHALDLGSRRVLWRHRTSRPIRYQPDWETHQFLPTASGVYYETASWLAKVAR